MIKLNDSGVDFNQESHTYTLDGKELQGITGMIGRQLFPDKYSNIPQFVLNKAAERGSMIHEQIELYDSGIIKDAITDELFSYYEIKKENDFITIANEYIVTDGSNFASGIDLVFDHKGKIALADIKTTSVLDENYIRWQLSIYAYLFELQNPELKVSELYGLWLRGGESELVPVERIPDGVVFNLLKAEIIGEKFSCDEVVKYNKDYPSQIIDAEKTLADLSNSLNELKEKKDNLLKGLLVIMKDNHIKSFKGKLITLSIKASGVRKGLDSKSLEEKYPDIYKEFLKETEVKESLTLKVNGNGDNNW